MVITLFTFYLLIHGSQRMVVLKEENADWYCIVLYMYKLSGCSIFYFLYI